MIRAASSALALLTVVAAPVAAQAGDGTVSAVARGVMVRGTVVLADGVAPAAGVIVLLESGPGVVAARALTDERGGFLATLASAGRYRLRALRIGYQPTIMDVVVEAAGTTSLRVVLLAPAVVLPSVAVRSEDVCRGSATDGAVVAQVWEEARKALLASGLSAAEPLFAEWIEYERTLDTTSRVVRDQRVRSTRMATTHAFRSLPAARLAEHGYVVDTDDGTMFHAPDADVLLSDSFAAMHCFHLEPPTRERPTMIGVGFRPVRDRRQVSDIYGTFWIDRESRELKVLEYRYTNLPSVTERVRPGGVVEFMRLASGSWLVQRWSIRMPQLVTLVPQTIRRRGVSVTGTPITVTAVRIVGGEVSRVDRANTLLFQGDGAALSVQVTPADSLSRASDVRITLDGTDYELLTDSLGRGRLSAVLPGAYQLRALTPLMDSLGVPAEPMDVAIRPDDGRPVSVPIPSHASLLRRLCGDPRPGQEGAHARGVVVDAVGLPVADAIVQLTWQQQIGVVSDRLMWHERSASTRTDSVGTWQLCDVPRDQGMLVRIRADSLAGQGALRVSSGALFASSHVALQRAAASERPALIGTLALHVTDSTSQPVADAQVLVTVAGRQRHRARTDAGGRALVPPLPVGSLTVEVRKVGFASGTVAAEIEAGENTLPIVMHTVSVPQLAAVRVVGNRTINARHAEFERRHASKDATASITADEIERRNPVSTWQMLSRVPSLMVLDSAGSIYARSSRMSSIVCWPRVAIDGQILSGIPNLAQLPPPREIFGIEVFAGSASTPLRYGGEGEGRYCGLIAIWTK